MRMLFICELEVLEGHPKPKHDHAIVDADSRDQAIEKVRQAFPGPDVDALYLFEVPREQWAKIPTDLIDKRMTKAVAEKVRIDCGMVLSDAARAILAKFPGPVTLQPSKEIWAFVFLMGLISAGLSALPLLLPPTGGWDLGLCTTVGFFLVAGVLCLVVSVIALVKVRMTLDAAGFEMRSIAFTRRKQWKDVRFFSIATIGGVNRVVYVDSKRHGFWAEVDARFLGGPNALLVDTFGFTADELAVLINRWRQRALSQSQSGPLRHLASSPESERSGNGR
jgi:hypothetical protein